MQNHSDITPLTLKEKVGYGLGDMASNFYMGFFGLFLLYYYTDVFGLSPAAAATMLLVTKVIDAISDPVMGLIADRTRSRWGKYRPYLLWAAIPYALAGYLLFLGPDLSVAGKLAYAYITYALVMLAYTAINVPYSALLAVISPVAEERTKATQFRFVFASLGTLCVGAFATPLVEVLGAGDQLQGFRLTIMLFAVLSVLLFWLTFVSTRERIQTVRYTSSVREDFAVLLSNPSWLILVFTSILVVIGLNIRFASTVFYLKYYLPTKSGPVFLFFDQTALLISCALVGQMIGALMTPKLSSYFEKNHLITGVSLLHILLLIVCYMIPPEQYGFLVLVHSLGILTFGITITLLFSMYTDCSEYGEWRSHKSIAGLTVSSSLFSLKFGYAIGAALPGFMLAWIGFVANEVQTASALSGIRLMFNILPAVFFLAGGLLMLFYRINKKTLRQLEQELQQRRA
jgi:GPH family glycoside/pentoside/hexuronide:cation symporter